jgi:[ribosomal protein S5]-alanine N-acetyltransferase
VVTVFLQGQGFHLRPLRTTDVDGPWVSWLNDQNVTHFMANGTWPVTVEDQRNYFLSSIGSRSSLVLAICMEGDGRHVGNIALNGIDLVNRRCELGILIGDSQARGKGIGQKAIQLLCGHGFNRLNMHKIWARVEEGNVSALKAFAKAGFEIEASLREEILHHGQWCNSIYLGLLEERFRELNAAIPK